MSLNGRLKRLEGSTGISQEDEVRHRQAANQRFLEGVAQDFEKRILRAVDYVEAGRVSRTDLEGKAPIEIAAVYVVLKARGDPRAEEVKEIHEEAKDEPRRQAARAEMERMKPGTTQAYMDWFEGLVERYAESYENRL
jgi:hypothetical protein